MDDGVETATDCIRVSNVILTEPSIWSDEAEEEVERQIKQQWDNAAEQLRGYKPNKPRNKAMLEKHYEVIEILVCDMTVIHEYPLMRTLSYLLAYIGWLDESGYPVTEKTVLNRTNIESAISDLVGRYEVSSLRTMRSCLVDFIWALGGDKRALGGTWPIRRNDPTAPYSDTDVGWIVKWAENHGARTGLSTARMALVLGLGAGGDPGESMNVTTDDIVATPDGVVVTFPDGRRVTVRREFEDLAIETLPLLDPGWVLLPRTKQRTGPNLYAFMNWNSDRRNGFLITMRRMRITWLMRHLVEGLPLDVLLASAQMETTAGLSRYLCHFPTRAPSDVARMLRGGGWS